MSWYPVNSHQERRSPFIYYPVNSQQERRTHIIQLIVKWREMAHIISKCDSFFQTKLVSFGRWVVFSCHVWKKKQNRTLRFVNKSLKMHLKNGIKLNSVFHTFIWRGWVGGLSQMKLSPFEKNCHILRRSLM